MSECDTFTVSASADGVYQYTDCYTGEVTTGNFTTSTTKVYSLTLPVVNSGTATFKNVTLATYVITAQEGCNGLFNFKPAPTFKYTDPTTGAVTNITVAKGTTETINSLGAPTFVSGCDRYNIVASKTNNRSGK
jgi:hypothetical protein